MLAMSFYETSSSCTYLPSFPPSKQQKPSYSRFLLTAPVTALADVTPHAKKPSDFPLTTHCRLRVQVGVTNRWRLPDALGSDLLGTSQAIKATSSNKKRYSRDIGKTPNRQSFDSFSESPREPSLIGTFGVRNGRHSAPPRLKSAISHHDERKSYYNKTVDSTFKIMSSKDPGTSKESPFSRRFFNQMHQYTSYTPPDSRRPTPLESFLHVSQTTAPYSDTDVIITALKSHWNLHRSFAQSSGLLYALISKGKNERNLDMNFNDNQGFSAPSSCQGVSVSISKYPAFTGMRRNTLYINLDIEDDLITKHAFASALCALYDEEHDFDRHDIVGVLAAATFLQMESVKNRCVNVMIEDIDFNNVCIFHAAAVKYELEDVEEFCEKWLGLNVVPRLSSSICLSQLTPELLEKTLKSSWLFVYDEYSLYKFLCSWVFLQQHPSLQMMPSWGTIVTWFMSIQDSVPFLENEEWKQYRQLFVSVRLNGITNPSQLDEISKMNVLPLDWLLKVFSQHYYSLQGGGDMSLMTRFENGAVRYGFILDQSATSYNEILSLHGFHFNIMAKINGGGICTVYMQRLKPTDKVLSQRISERQTFSVRQDREVRYAIKAQYCDGDVFISKSTGPKSQCFGFDNKSEKSDELKISSPTLPLYVTFSLLFPPS